MRIVPNWLLAAVMVLIGCGVANAADQCMLQCRKDLSTCQRQAQVHRHECIKPCRDARAKLTDCPANATVATCPGMAAAHDCAGACSRKQQTEGRNCLATARMCRDTCTKAVSGKP
jgi:hypothetical protein